jgi:hypothetical protein
VRERGKGDNLDMLSGMHAVMERVCEREAVRESECVCERERVCGKERECERESVCI